MSLPGWHKEAISRKHDRDSFDCGEPALNEFLKQHARKSHEKGAARTFLALSRADGRTILGYYSLCPASLQYARVPDVVRKGLARHDVPVFRLGRLAVGREFQGHGLGGQLILAAGRRCFLAAAEVGGVAILIDAKSERAAGWYASYGAVALSDAPLSLVLPLATIQAALQAGGHLQILLAEMDFAEAELMSDRPPGNTRSAGRFDVTTRLPGRTSRCRGAAAFSPT